MCYIILYKGVIFSQRVNAENTDTSQTLEQAAEYHTLLPTH